MFFLSSAFFPLYSLFSIISHIFIFISFLLNFLPLLFADIRFLLNSFPIILLRFAPSIVIPSLLVLQLCVIALFSSSSFYSSPFFFYFLQYFVQSCNFRDDAISQIPPNRLSLSLSHLHAHVLHANLYQLIGAA